jgi:hypothetical protein
MWQVGTMPAMFNVHGCLLYPQRCAFTFIVSSSIAGVRPMVCYCILITTLSCPPIALLTLWAFSHLQKLQIVNAPHFLLRVHWGLGLELQFTFNTLLSVTVQLDHLSTWLCVSYSPAMEVSYAVAKPSVDLPPQSVIV